MTKRLIIILLISFSLLTCTINVNAKVKGANVSSINSLQINHVLADGTDSDTCGSVLGDPTNDKSTAWLIKKIVGYIRIVGIMLVVALSGFDFTKAIIQNDEKQMAGVRNRLVTRILGIILLFMLPTIVMSLLGAFGFTKNCDVEVFEAIIVNSLVGLKVL